AVEGARRWSAVLQGVQQMLSAGLNAFECSRGLLPPPKKLRDIGPSGAQFAATAAAAVTSSSNNSSSAVSSLSLLLLQCLQRTEAAIQASSRSHSEAAAAEAAAGAGAGAGVSAAGEGMASVAGEGRAEEAEEGRAAAGEEARGATMEGKGPGEKESSKGSAPVYMSTREACALLSSLSSSLPETDVALLSACLPVLLLLLLHEPIPSSFLSRNDTLNVPLSEPLQEKRATPLRSQSLPSQSPVLPPQQLLAPRVPSFPSAVPSLPPAVPSLPPAVPSLPPAQQSVQQAESASRLHVRVTGLQARERSVRNERSVQRDKCMQKIGKDCFETSQNERSVQRDKCMQKIGKEWDVFTVPDGVSDALHSSSNDHGARKRRKLTAGVGQVPSGACAVSSGEFQVPSGGFQVPSAAGVSQGPSDSDAPGAFQVPSGGGGRRIRSESNQSQVLSVGRRAAADVAVPDWPVSLFNSHGAGRPSRRSIEEAACDSKRRLKDQTMLEPKIPAQERAYEEKSVWIRGGGLQVDGWNGGENGKDGEDGKRRAIPFPAWEEVLMYGSRAMPLAWMLQPLEQISPFYFSGCSSMSCGADGEGTGSIDRSRGGKSSGGSESSGGRDSSGEGVTGGSELLSQEGKRSWAFIQILSADPIALRTGGLDVRFTGEGGAAGPGVLREFFAFVRAHLFDPNLGLFSPVPHDPSRFSLSLASRANPAEAKEYLRFAGRILALALAHQVPLGVKLSRSLFVLLAARTPSLADAADDDPQLVASCRSLLAMAEREREEAAQGGGGREGGGVESLCLTFVASVEDPMGGAPIEAELVPGGSERVVCADDVAEFVQRMVQFRVCGVVEEEGEALRRGMEDILGSGGGRDVIVGKGDVVEGREGTDGKGGMGGTEGSLGGLGGGFERDEEQHLSIHKDDDCCGDSIEGLSLAAMLAPLSCDDLNSLLHGEDRHVAVSDWQAHTVYHGYCPEDPQVLWFWEVVESFSGEQRKSLLFFATAVSNLPVNGFKGLAMGFHLHRADGDLSRLPTAHTRFHQFLLPPYESIEMMRMRLLTFVSTSYIVHSFGFA
ncbi:unnamed protein product, partial [Closterium sp. NIES-64]